MALGWCFPNAVMQYAIPDLENLSIDTAALGEAARSADAMLEHERFQNDFRPEGTFYLWSQRPKGDPQELWSELASRNVFVMPGTLMNSPAYLRISLTASMRW
jgi:aspartate aminotransferase